jgi:hypothetical protein
MATTLTELTDTNPKRKRGTAWFYLAYASGWCSSKKFCKARRLIGAKATLLIGRMRQGLFVPDDL